MTATALREALQRLLGLIPTLFLVSIVAFWGLSKAFHAQTADAARSSDLPLFFNGSPAGVNERARLLAEQIAKNSAATETPNELVRLGGAALPSLMPYLDSLLPQERARVAFALAPLAMRMGIAESEELQTPQAAAGFWNRYWTDHFIDFRPQVVERTVARLAERPSALRRAEVKHLDTYALPDLMEALEAHRDSESYFPLLSVASHITGQPWHLGSAATAADRAARLRECLTWWRLERRHFTSYDGTRRVIAMLQETQYGQWIMALMRGQTVSGASESEVHWEWTPTLALIGAGIVGGYFVGPLLAAWSAIAVTGRFVAMAVSLFLASLPAAAVANWMQASNLASRPLALFAMLVLGAGLLCFYQYQATRDALSNEFVQTHRAFGASPLRAALGALRSSSVVTAAHLANHGPSLFTAACVVEWAFDWHGLGWLTLHAVRARDVATLTGVAILGTLLTGSLQVMSGLLLSRVERMRQIAP